MKTHSTKSFSTVSTGILLALSITFFSLSFTAYSQREIPIQICENCLNDVVSSTFKATKEALPGTHEDSSFFTVSLPPLINNSQALLYISDADKIEVIDGPQKHLAGRFTSKSELASTYARYLIPIELTKASRLLQVKVKQYDHKQFTVSPKLIIGSDIEDAKPLYLSQNEPARVVNLVCILLLFLLLFYSIYQSVILKNRIFKAYALYLFSVLIFLLLFSDEYLQWHLILPENLHQYGAINILPQGIIYAVYTEFGIVFLDIKKKYTRIFKVSRAFQFLVIGITGFHATYLIYSGGNQAVVYKYFFLFYGVIFLLSNYLTYFVLFKIKDKNKWFLLIGSFVIGFAAGYEVYNVFAKESPKPRDFFYTLPSGFMHFSLVEISYVLESFIFLMGINYKSVKKDKENVALKEHLIEQLKEKEQLEKEVSKLLAVKLENSEKKLSLEKALSENERNNSLLMESQLTSLQLQMNPHYLFNSLNSINDFIVSKKPQEASEYLALYARMMRNILKTSDETFNTLENELKYSEDYLALENLRFNSRFTYEIILPKSSDILLAYIPTMLLQPILENAVWHGIMPFKRKGKIMVDTSDSNKEQIVIRVIDTGDGFDPQKNTTKSDSYGLKNIDQKIILLRRIYGEQVFLTTEKSLKPKQFSVTLRIPNFQEYYRKH